MAQDMTIEKRAVEKSEPERLDDAHAYVPNVDIIERESDLLLVADMPGVTPDGVDVHYERGVLTIRGHVAPRQDQATEYLMREYGVGGFHRSFELGEGIDAATISAELSDGALTVHLPKANEVMPRKIAVQTA